MPNGVFLKLLLRNTELADVSLSGAQCLRHVNELEGKPFKQIEKMQAMAPAPVHPVAGGDIGIPDYPPLIPGQKVQLKIHGKHRSMGLQVHCSNPAHVNYFEYSFLRLDCSHGEHATEGYLGAWLMQADKMTGLTRQVLPASQPYPHNISAQSLYHSTWTTRVNRF